MKLRASILAAMLAGLCAAPAPLSKVPELAKRIPGKPQRCISGQSGLLFRTAEADPRLLLFDDGKTIWLSSLDASCGFQPGQTVIPQLIASYCCRGDVVLAGGCETLLPIGRRCVLGDFTPYRSVK